MAVRSARKGEVGDGRRLATHRRVDSDRLSEVPEQLVVAPFIFEDEACEVGEGR